MTVSNTLAAPELMIAELCNACWKAFRQKLLKAQQVNATSGMVRRYVRMFHPLEPLAPRAVFISRASAHPVYDCFHLVLAEREFAPLVTVDQRLLATLGGKRWARHVRDLVSFAPSP